ncbi:ABC transporter substrate-binding protein [Aromatoleum petrolei]|uniref:ABC transporter substrate-binding protein n=1 Tax=Aromatoleum petrolei TaxID=76116 RepID=A0ABX1MKS8_9RHOO|nr:ABC transporter substrate-binding protein [Aromatoleum petrolei]NMF87253.1 ABC transporter substrate-binding protein [Aromatoleum petrolei]QTQ38497.1 Amino acid/amide ABC transporter, periplasmic binding protein [Aromatoleum petrolei]
MNKTRDGIFPHEGLLRPASRMRIFTAAALGTIAWGLAHAAPAAISDGEVRVGLLADMSSIYANISGRGSETAARMAIEDAGSEVAGRPIRLIVADHGNDVVRAVETARRWLDEEGVDVIADVVASPAALAVQELNRTRGAVVFYNGVMTSDLTGSACAPTGIHWMYDGYAFTTAIGRDLTQRGARSWYLVTVDNAFGLNVQAELAKVIRANGGHVLGAARHALGQEQLFAQLRQAAQSGADAIALINAGDDMIRAVRQSYDLLTVSKGQTVLAAVATTLNDVHLMKPQLAQGLKLAHAFYWNRDPETRAWSERFRARTGTMPNDMQAGVYSALTHYFKAVAAGGSDKGSVVVAKMRELPIRDPIVRNARLREDGRMVHDTYLMEVKKPAEITIPWDYLRILRTIPAEEAFKPMAEGGCPLVTH